MFKSDEQISSPRLVLKLQGCEVLHKIMNSQGSRIEKNAHAQRVQMEKKQCGYKRGSVVKSACLM